MMKLLNIELKKLLPYRAFKIMLLIFVISLAGTVIVGKQLNKVSDMIPGEQVNTLGFPNVWNFYLYTCLFFNIILALLVIFVVSNEYTYRTIRQNIIDGMTRNDIVTGKILLIFLLSVLSTLTVYITGIIAGMMYSSSWEFADIFERNSLLFGYFLQTLCILAMAYLFATIFKRSGIATIAFILFIFPIDVLINQAIFKGDINDYMPVSNMFRKIIEAPYNALLRSDAAVQTEPGILSICVTVFYILFFFGAGWYITKKRDL
ncbi:MAG: ABC transporter permease subunit [Fimbriimonadaceae bacterium]|nr:ABC transporter permease subunit [Chitinophagales bacterium]